MPYPYYGNPYQYQIPQFQQPQNQQTQGGMIWVSSQAEAAAYLMAPNSAVTLWDSTSPTVYLKQTDASGKPSMKIYDLVERSAMPVEAVMPKEEYVTRKDFDELVKRVEAMTEAKTDESNL